MAIIENIVRLIKRKSILRLNDSIVSIAQGIFHECVRSVFILIKHFILN